MILFFDSSDFDQIRLALIGATVLEHKFATKNLSEELLSETKKFLKNQKVTLADISSIAVVIGPGGFSRIRTTVATANALAFGLKASVIAIGKAQIPVDLRKLSKLRGKQMAVPVYDKQPNITVPRK